MHCNICQRPCSTRLPFNCASCAQEALYHTRVRLAHALLEQEAVSSQAEHKLKRSQATSLKQSTTTPSTGDDYYASLTLQSADVQRNSLKERIQLLDDCSRELRADTGKIKDEIKNRTASNAKRKAELAAARQELTRREAADFGPTIKQLGRIRNRWDVLHTRTAESRLLLCEEAAGLYGLRKQRRRGARSKVDTYALGGLPIFHLRDLNNANPADVTTINSILAHLVHLISHYLSLRLPAEITLPHRDYPLPTILPPASSYTGSAALFPNANPSNSSSNSPSTSRALQSSQTPRPRPLFLKRKLASVAKEDPPTYAAFVEGTTLLAWNVAWLCKTQGIGVGDDSWEEVCDIGRNLWKLVAAQPTGLRPTSTSHDRRTKQDLEVNPTPNVPQGSQQNTNESSSTSFGFYSHDTVHSNLTGAAGSEYMRKWRLQDPIKVVDRVKQLLQNDRTGAGWEILEGKEWEAESMDPEQSAPAAVADASTVVVDGGAAHDNDVQDPKSTSATPSAEISQDKSKGTSGWTKLKSR
ncbi:MAG: hypothetical protein LQ343_004234 [Gyalolechia ehrenbergii]|nr:MAG: hypothetical protein LQ343_004234 [Gyalolechia ehrenbergii]